MSQRSLSLAVLSAALAFVGGYALLGTLRPVGTPTGAGWGASDPTKVVAVSDSALVPVGDGSTDWMLVGPDGTILAGPDGRPPATGSSAGRDRDRDRHEDEDHEDHDDSDDDEHDDQRRAGDGSLTTAVVEPARLRGER